MKSLLLRLTLCFILGLWFSVSHADVNSYSNVIKKVSRSIVSIYAANSNKSIKSLRGLQHNGVSVGSGVIISKDGLIVTNNHVIHRKTNIRVVLHDGRDYRAKLISADRSLDLALLKVDINENLNYLELNSQLKMEVGDVILAIGNPFGLGQTVTRGIISALPTISSYTNDIIQMGKLIQIDAAINPGNSGGGLINTKGELLGINTAVYSRNGTFQGIGFSIPVTTVSLFVRRALTGEKLTKYWLGLTGMTVDRKMYKALGLKIPTGVFITNIYPNSPASLAKLEKGDVIIKLDGQMINSSSELSFFISSIDSSSDLEVEIIRDGKKRIFTLKPDVPSEIPKKNLIHIPSGILSNLDIVNNSPAVSFNIGSSLDYQGAVIYKINNASLVHYGFKVGDGIYKINNTIIKSTDDIKKFLRTPIKSIVFKRHNRTIYFNIHSQ